MNLKEKREMKYIITIDDKEVEVTEEIYREYYRMERRERYLVERDMKQQVHYYNALDTDEMNGIDAFPSAINIEEILIKEEGTRGLYQALNQLKEHELELIRQLYFTGRTERELAIKSGVRQQTLNEKKVRILKKLKKFIKNPCQDGF